MKNRGKLIVFEGLDGAGTPTPMKVLGEKLSENGRNAFVTHEPTDNPIGKLVRQALQKKSKFHLTPLPFSTLQIETIIYITKSMA